jgi:hypothetical protein
MNRKILLTTVLASASFFATAQYAAKTFAITGGTGGDYSWQNIRQIDITTGKLVKDIFVTGSSAKFLDGSTNQELNAVDVKTLSPGNYVAASAFDVRTNKLFYSTMHTGQLRWIDLNDNSAQLNIYTKEQQFVSSADITDESVNITRMCIGADGNGYALNNDGNHLYRFTTGSKPTVTDLGNLVDADANSGLSVHNKCSSWGGDLIADAFGKLYLITANHNVYVIDVDSRIATFKGAITGLPGTYSTNGAAVDDNGDIVVNSSLSKEGYYKVKLADLSATKIEGSEQTYSVSDLANGNLLLQREADALGNSGAIKHSDVSMNTGNGHVYPNPTSNSVFNVSFDGLKNGEYLINITDLSGKSILNKTVNVGVAGQIETVNVTPKLAVGMYLIKVSSSDKQNSFTERIIIN